MKNIINLLEELIKNKYTITGFNIFITDENYKLCFTELINKIKKVEEFVKIKNIFPNIDPRLIRYIKTYTTDKNEEFKNIVIFNNDLYENDQREIPENQNINYKIIEENSNTKRIINYISYNKNFISDFISKQNKKKKISIPLLKAEMFNKEVIGFVPKDCKKEFDTKKYSQCKEKYLLKKDRHIDFSINKEQLLTNIRFVLPNVFIICLKDQTYIYRNKIIISDKLILENNVFNNMIEKFIFIKNVFENVYETKLLDENIRINLSVKRDNTINLKNNALLFSLPTDIIVSEKYINFKYVKNYEDLIERQNKIKKCLELQKKLYKCFNGLDKKQLLLYNDDNLNLIFSNAFTG